jgi:hypothetical protein
MFRTIAIFAVFPFIPGLMSLSHAMPYHFVDGSLSLQGRTNPYFPAQPPSCPVCQQNYDSISECAQVAPVFANFSMVCAPHDINNSMSLFSRFADPIQSRSVHNSHQVRL